MDKSTILAIEAGEELDKLVATEVMGEPMPELTPQNALDLQLVGSPVKSPKSNWLCLCRYEEGDIPMWRPLPYSTDISAAWQVLEKLTEVWKIKDKLVLFEVIYGCGAYEAKVETWNENKQDWNEPIFSGSCDKAPEAISKAALIVRLAG